MGAAGGKQTTPNEKYAITIGINDYRESKQGYHNLTNSAQNAFQMQRFFIKHGYDVTSNISDYSEIRSKYGGKAIISDLIPIFADMLDKAKEATSKNRKHFIVYYSGIVIEADDTSEICGIDSQGNLIQLEKFCEAFAQYKYCFVVFFIQGIFFKEPKRKVGEFEQLVAKQGLNSQQLQKHFQHLKKKSSMVLMYSSLDYYDPTLSPPQFIMSRQTHDLINTVNQSKSVNMLDLHILLRERYMNLGVPDVQWKTWKIFKDLKIEEITLQENSRKYIGEISNTFMQGFGICQFLNKGHRYEGEFEMDNFEGYGVYIWQKERQYYEGEWRDGKQNGLGMFVKDGGIRFEGEFKDGKFNGKGIAIYPNGDFYDGDWKDNTKSGDGFMYFDDGSKYEGQFVKGFIHGKGKMKYKNGDIYEGEFKKSKKNGIGEYRFKDVNKVYTGAFKDDVIEGFGKMQLGQIMTYEGEFKDSKQNGKGQITYSNGMVFEGEFLNDKKFGNGTLLLEDDIQIKGFWQDDKLISGLLFNENGQQSSETLEEVQAIATQRMSIYHALSQIQYNNAGLNNRGDTAKLNSPQKTPDINRDPSSSQQKVNLRPPQQSPNQISKIQEKEIIRELLSLLIEKAFLQIEYDEEFQEYQNDPTRISQRRNQLLRYESLIASTTSSSQQYGSKPVDFRQSIKDFFQKYYSAEESNKAQYEMEFEIAPSLCIKEIENDEYEYKVKIPSMNLVGKQKKKEINLLTNIQDQEYFK